MVAALSWQAAYVTELLTERASPLAVAEQRVVLTTNAGLVAALYGRAGLSGGSVPNSSSSP